MWEYMWGEYVSQLIRQLIRVYSYLCRIERSSCGTVSYTHLTLPTILLV